MAELSTKPYLIRAIYEWCVDNGYCPYIAVVVDERTVVPREFVRNGEVVLNVSAVATNRLQIGNDLVEFEARFGGVARQVSIPVENVSAIFAQENGHGMAFEVAKAPAGGGEHTGGVDERDDDDADRAAPGSPDAAAAQSAAAESDTDGPDADGSDADGSDADGSEADAPAGARRRPAKRSRKAAASPADEPAGTAEGAAPHSRRKPALASVPKHEGDERPRAPRAEPRRRAPISAVPSRRDAAPDGDRGSGAGADAADGDGPETTPPARRKPRLTRVK